MGRYSPISLRGSLSQAGFNGRQLPSFAVIELFAILDEASVFLATSIKISGIMTYTKEDSGDQLHALRIRADLEQSELAALTSNSVGTPKPMLWER